MTKSRARLMEARIDGVGYWPAKKDRGGRNGPPRLVTIFLKHIKVKGTMSAGRNSTGRDSTRLALRWFSGVVLALGLGGYAHAASSWERPAEQLAEQVAKVLGAGQVQLAVSNRSTIAAAELSAIRKLLVQDLKARGIAVSGAESANQVRVTLSENARERLWVAEIVEGSQRRVVMVRADREAAVSSNSETGMVLKKKLVWSSNETMLAPMQSPGGAVLAALETTPGLVVLEQEDVIIYAMTAAGWREEKRVPFDARHTVARDGRGVLVATPDGAGFTAYTAGTACRGSHASSLDGQGSGWTVYCHESDDPWPVAMGNVVADGAAPTAAGLKAFYNSGRNFFTGVVTPAIGLDLPPFYSMAAYPRAGAAQAALVLSGIDGKVQIAEAGALKQVSGTRDWGSDFAAVRSGCGAGEQVLASSSGEALKDSLRAYDITRQEAVAVSAPLEMGGTVTALWTAPDGASVLAVVRESSVGYEVDRVTALCP